MSAGSEQRKLAAIIFTDIPISVFVHNRASHSDTPLNSNPGSRTPLKTYLFFIVNRGGLEFLPVRIRTINRDGPRSTIRRDHALTIGEHFSAFHRRNPVGVVVHNFVGRRVPSKVPLCLIR